MGIDRSVATANGFDAIKSIHEGTSDENSRVMELSNDGGPIGPDVNIQSKSLRLDGQGALEQLEGLQNLETDRLRRATVK